MNNQQLHELLYQALEAERGGIQIYRAAIECAANDELRSEWEEYLEQTTQHEEVLLTLFNRLGLDPAVDSTGRRVVRHIGESLVAAIELAKRAGDTTAAQLVAAECVVLAETKDHLDWSLIGMAAEKASGKTATALHDAHEQVEGDEDDHLYHTKGWSRELWIEALGMDAVLPPPEERKHVKTAIGAARAEQARDTMI